MRRWKRLFYYLLINIVVSAFAMVVVLKIWERIYYPETGIITSFLESDLDPTVTMSLIASATPTPPSIPSLEPTMAVQTYTVQPGDTIGLIADIFDTTVEEIMRMNGFSDPNALGVGEVLYVPAPTALPIRTTGTSSSNAESDLTETPAQSSGNPGVEIAGVMSVGDLQSERILFRGTGESELVMTGWRLQDEDGHVYIFPQLTLFKEGAVHLHSKSGMNTVVDLYWGMSEPVLRPGETIILMDDREQVKATYQVP
jgi:LysM repeat protein